MILLKDIWEIENVEDYKVHFAKYNSKTQIQPLDDWVNDPQIWQSWQEYKPPNSQTSVFNRQFIFSLMRFYHETDIWLFGGVFEVLEDLGNRYKVELTKQGKNFIGRLKLHSSYRSRPSRVNFENHYGFFRQLPLLDLKLSEESCGKSNHNGILKVQEILREPYSGRLFPGYENIDLSFAELETLIRNNRPDWQAALANVKGVYLISDSYTGKQYVGATYGDMGIWQRWNNYVDTGHGGNVELRKLVKKHGIDYCRKYFQFALLEHRQAHTSVNVIHEREKWWKNILFTRNRGLNRT